MSNPSTPAASDESRPAGDVDERSARGFCCGALPLAERALQAAVLDLLPDAALLLARDGKVESSNRAARELLDLDADQIRERHVEELFTGIERDELWRLSGGSVTRVVGRRDQPEFPAELHAQVTGFAGRQVLAMIIRDVREHQQLERELARARQLEVAGRVASGVAHDLNNLLSILSITCYLLDRASPTELAALSGDLRDTVDRGSALTSRLLSLTRRPVAKARPVSINAQLRSIERLVRRSMGNKVEVCLELDPDAGRVLIDPTQLDQVVLNLAINAERAMPRGGRLMIRTAPMVDDAQRDLTRVEVADTGHGMSAKLQRRVFEPFFSTRADAGGTGLGLSIVREIIERAGGELELHSSVGEGARFVIMLPRLAGAQAEAEAESRCVRAPEVLGAGRTALLVDDDLSHLRSMARLLKVWGVHALQASGAGEALLVAEREPADIDFALVSLAMPYMGGVELSARLVRLRAQLPVLLICGPDREHEGEVLRKPLKPGRLAFVLERVLQPRKGDDSQ